MKLYDTIIKQGSPDTLLVSFNAVIVMLLVTFILLLISTGVVVSTALASNIFCGGFLSFLPLCWWGRFLVKDLWRRSNTEIPLTDCPDGAMEINHTCWVRNCLECFLSQPCTNGGHCEPSKQFFEAGNCFYPYSESATLGLECRTGHQINGVCFKPSVDDPKLLERTNNQFCAFSTDCFAITTFGAELGSNIDLTSISTLSDVNKSTLRDIRTSMITENQQLTGIPFLDNCLNGSCARGASSNPGPFPYPLLIGYNSEKHKLDMSRVTDKFWFHVMVISFLLHLLSYPLIFVRKTRTLAIAIYIISIIGIIVSLIIRAGTKHEYRRSV